MCQKAVVPSPITLDPPLLCTKLNRSKNVWSHNLQHQWHNSYAIPQSKIIRLFTSGIGNEHFRTFFAGILVGLVKRTKRKIQCRCWASKTQQTTRLYSTNSQGYIKTMKILFSFTKLCWHFDQSRRISAGKSFAWVLWQQKRRTKCDVSGTNCFLLQFAEVNQSELPGASRTVVCELRGPTKWSLVTLENFEKFNGPQNSWNSDATFWYYIFYMHCHH